MIGGRAAHHRAHRDHSRLAGCTRGGLAHRRAGRSLRVASSSSPTVRANPLPPPLRCGDGGQAVRGCRCPATRCSSSGYAGYQAARGEVVAITEDHSLGRAGLGRAHHRGSRAVPERGAQSAAQCYNRHRREARRLGGVLPDPGAVHAAARQRRCAAHLRPCERVVQEPRARAAGRRRGAGRDRFPRAAGRARRRGARRRRLDPGRAHNQSQGLRGTSLAEFDNGRTIAGYRRRADDARRLAAHRGSPVLPTLSRGPPDAHRAQQADARGHDHGSRWRRSCPAHLWFQYCAMAGELLGYAAGPGDSPRRLF